MSETIKNYDPDTNGSPQWYAPKTYSQSGPLPSSFESEANILGNIIINPSLLYRVQNLDPNIFYNTRNRIIFKALTEMHENGEEIDIVTLREYLEKTNQLDKSGGSSHMTYLTEMTLSQDTFDHHVTRIIGYAEKRETWSKAHKIIQAVERNEGIKEIRDQIRNLNRYYIEPNATEIVKLRDQSEPNPRRWLLQNAIPWGYPTSIYADGGVGKSFLALFIGMLASIGGKNFLGLNFPVKPIKTLYVDWELEIEEIKRRTKSISLGLELLREPDHFYYISPKKNIYDFISDLPSLVDQGFEFMIIDSLGAACLEAEKVIEVVKVFNGLKQSGLTSIVLDHQPKQQIGDNYSSKTQYGSVYKFNLSRSQFQLSRVEKNDNKVTLRLKHNKSNFGRILDELMFDIAFEGDRVLFLKSESCPSEEKDLQTVYGIISELIEKDQRVNQSSVIENLNGVFSRDKAIKLLNKGVGIFWTTKQVGS